MVGMPFGRVYGDARLLVYYQQVIVLVQDVNRYVLGRKMAFLIGKSN